MDVRTVGRLVEAIHAPVYFAPEPQQEYAALGLRGYWRGYFASRAAALGTVDAATVTRLFGGFAPRMVERAIPEIWTIASPHAALAARRRGADAALTRLIAADALPGVASAAAELAAVVDAADYRARPLAGAHAEVPRPGEPLAALWHGCTVLRELRGDEHLAALAGAGLSWPQPHLLRATTGRLDPKQREYRGFTEQEWDEAAAALRDRGLTGAAADDLLEAIEDDTDRRVADVFASADLDRLAALLRPIALATVGALPFPNAIGLPDPRQPSNG